MSNCRLVCIVSATVSRHRDHCGLRVRQTPKIWNIFNCHTIVRVFGDIVRYNLRQPSLRNSSCNVFVSTYTLYYYTYFLPDMKHRLYRSNTKKNFKKSKIYCLIFYLLRVFFTYNSYTDSWRIQATRWSSEITTDRFTIGVRLSSPDYLPASWWTN